MEVSRHKGFILCEGLVDVQGWMVGGDVDRAQWFDMIGWIEYLQCISSIILRISDRFDRGLRCAVEEEEFSAAD